MLGAISIIERLAGPSKELPFADREFFGLASPKAMETLGYLASARAEVARAHGRQWGDRAPNGSQTYFLKTGSKFGN
ncbi:hypothetical protein EMCG_09137 [[Emmonsia] crescens]|uniref:Uncharacterized protein n=1 Tax=[Emmonsia] crescens TaxID=73230 RepID=A0A0G2JA18_9EURO|nr:hypothetical protein EMCG_09137 [Emmonsia crescens UAMH 3008]